MVSLHKFDDLLFNKNTKDLVDVESQVQHIQSPYLELVQVIYEVCHHRVQVAQNNSVHVCGRIVFFSQFWLMCVCVNFLLLI